MKLLVVFITAVILRSLFKTLAEHGCLEDLHQVRIIFFQKKNHYNLDVYLNCKVTEEEYLLCPLPFL